MGLADREEPETRLIGGLEDPGNSWRPHAYDEPSRICQIAAQKGPTLRRLTVDRSRVRGSEGPFSLALTQVQRRANP